MRLFEFSLLALPLLAAAANQDSPIDQAKAAAQYWFDKISSYIPNPNQAHSPPAVAAKAGGRSLHILTLDDWETTIRSSVKPGSTKPEEWWVFVTGGNKTCFGRCLVAETAFNQTAALWLANPTAPHLAFLNCEKQPVLCNSWSAGVPSLWVMQVSAPPAPVIIHSQNLNMTTTTVKTFTDMHKNDAEWKTLPPYTGWFHPFDGPLAQYGLAVPLGYFFWFFTVVPSWAFMIGISFLSRTMMNRRMPQQARQGGAAPAAGAGAGAGAAAAQ